MRQTRQVIREFRWREIFPSLMLVRVFHCSVRIHALLLSLIATILMAQGWRLIAIATLPESLQSASAPVSPAPDAMLASLQAERGIAFEPLFRPLVREYERFAAPARRLFSLQATWAERAYLLFGCGWTLLVGAFFAGVLCRAAAFDLASQERYGVFRAMRFVVQRYRSFLSAPLIPLALLAAMTLPVIALGLFGQLVSTFVASLAWGLALIWGLAMGMAALITLTSWPLIWPALASEDSDAFDALGASFGYSSQRPFSYLAYVLIAAFVSAVGLLIFGTLVWLGRALLHFGLTTGGGAELFAEFYGLSQGEAVPSLTTQVVAFWEYFFAALGDAYLFSAFWTSATAVFLLLRYDVDGAELDEIYNDRPGEQKPMPKLAREMGLTEEASSMAAPTAPASPEAPKAAL